MGKEPSARDRSVVKIGSIKVIVTSPGRNYVTVKIEAEDGIYGIGDATLNGRELAVAAYLSEHVVPLLIGRETGDIEAIWQYLYRGAYWRRGPVTMAAIAGVDMALWDIKGKRLGTPVWDLLGGRCRQAIRVYTHASSRTLDGAVDEVRRALAEGYEAVRVQCLVPGIDEMYGVPRAAGTTEPEGLPFVEQGWSSDAYLRFTPTLFAAVREAVGPEPLLLHDAHHRLTPAEAGWLGRRLEEFRLFWLEDAVLEELQDGYRLVRQHTTTPLAVGEVFNSIYDCERLIRKGWIDYLRASALHAGGISHLRKLAAFAEPYHVRMGCHGAADLSPVTMAAAAHFGIAVHNVAIQEYAAHLDDTNRVFPHEWSVRRGYLSPGDKPGLGVDIDEQLAASFPYKRNYLPVSQLADGTAWNW
jgi:mannonate dehydratase